MEHRGYHHGQDWRDIHDNWRNDWKAGRGDIQAMILDVLQSKPMHGYEIIRYLEDRSQGVWRPSPGSIYPTLQMLVDQGLIEAEEDKGKKIYSLTEAGKQKAKSQDPQDMPWERGNRAPERIMQLRMIGMQFMKTMKQIIRHGSDQQFDAAREVVEKSLKDLCDIADGSDASETGKPYSEAG